MGQQSAELAATAESGTPPFFASVSRFPTTLCFYGVVSVTRCVLPCTHIVSNVGGVV